MGADDGRYAAPGIDRLRDDLGACRIGRRARPFEKDMEREYIRQLNEAYNHFFFHYTGSDLLVVNTSDIDFVDRHEDLQELLRRLTEPIKGTQYFLPLGTDAASA